MAGYRLARRAAADLTAILTASEERWGPVAKQRYEALLAAGMRTVTAHPEGRTTRDRSDLAPGLRSFHLRHASAEHAKVKHPVHILFYRIVAPGQVEIARILHERMDPSRHSLG